MSNGNPSIRSEGRQTGRAPMPDFYMPAMPPRGLIHAVKRWVSLHRQRRHVRRRFLPLLAYGDRIVEDMGYHREDILSVLRLPLRVDALQALQALQERRQRARD